MISFLTLSSLLFSFVFFFKVLFPVFSKLLLFFFFFISPLFYFFLVFLFPAVCVFLSLLTLSRCFTVSEASTDQYENVCLRFFFSFFFF